MTHANIEVTHFLDAASHPRREEIDALRELVLSATPTLEETIKWNAPNYVYKGEDRITFKIFPPKKLYVVFHAGVKKQATALKSKISDPHALLSWRDAQRATLCFESMEHIRLNARAFSALIAEWIRVTSA